MAFTVAAARKGWGKRVPTHQAARRALKKKCGTVCFIDPSGNRGAGSFPVCRKLSITRGKCVLDCEGLRAAFSRSRQYKYSRFAKRAVKLACKAGCKWTQAAERCPA